MLYFIFAWTLLIITCCSIGTAVLNLLRANCFERVGDRFIVAVWLGIVFLAISLLATSLVLPLSPSVGGIIILSLILGSFLLQKTWNELFSLISSLSRRLIFGYLILACGIAALTTKQVTWLDTGLYHFSSIKWLSKFGAVPGLALLYSNLGFTSSWFAFAAPWNAEILDSRASAIANGFIFLISVFHFLICLAHIFKNKSHKSDWFVISYSSIILPFVATNNLMSVILRSSSPDLPIIFLILVVSWTILLISENKSATIEEVKNSILDATAIPVIISAGAVTMKLTVLPLLFISGLFYVFCQRFSAIRVLMGSLIAFLLLLPFFSSGIITSGCPLFPSNLFCIDLPWSLTKKLAKKAATGTHGSASWYRGPESETNYVFGLLWNWLNSENLNKVIVVLIIVSILCCIPIVISSLKGKERGQLWLLALASAGITFLMVTAPFFRFALGYIIIIPILLMANYGYENSHICLKTIDKLTVKYQSRDAKKAILAVGYFCLTLTSIILFNKTIQAQLILPPPLPKGEVIQKQVNGITYFSPKRGSLCWAAELPCVFKIEDYVQLRDPARGMKAGFVRKK